MRLRDPGRLDQAIQRLDELKINLGNCRAGLNAEDTRNRWLNWWRSADPQLRNLFVDGEIAASLYRTRVEIAGLNLAGGPWDVLSHEVDVWTERFDEVIRELCSLKPFIERPGHIVVPDTSALIEGPKFTDFDWHSLEGVSRDAPVRLILPILVIEELDDLKGTRRERAAARARFVLRSLWELRDDGDPRKPVNLPGKDVTVEVLLDDWWHVRRPGNDEELIQRAVAIKELTGKSVTLAAADYAMLYRARAAGLRAVVMDRVAT